MTRWEYRFIDLHRGSTIETPDGNFFRGFNDEIRQAGQEGWQAVGEVGLTYNAGIPATNTVRSGLLMLKRPMGG